MVLSRAIKIWSNLALVIEAYSDEVRRRQDDLLKRSNFHVIHPVQVAEDGRILKKNVLITSSNRRRRHVSDDQAEFEDIFYKVKINGLEHRMELSRRDDFISQNFSIQFESSNNIERYGNRYQHCHFSGRFSKRKEDDHPSRVALSNCNGLQGFMRFQGNDFFLEPLWNTTKEEHEEHPHVMIEKESSFMQFDDVNISGGDSCTIVEDDEHKEKTVRSRRSLNSHRRYGLIESHENIVEAMVTLDKRVVMTHGREYVDLYTQTIMHIVSELYADPTLGNRVKIVLVRIIVLVEDNPDLALVHRAESTLHDFCLWQNSKNIDSGLADESGILHHDNAILLTGYNICSQHDIPCGTLGIAHRNGMCDPQKSCNINQDVGLGSAFIIAHEIGHNFGMHHDGYEDGSSKSCSRDVDKQIMAPQINSGAYPFSWSRCSRYSINNFLDSGEGHCLLNNPINMNGLAYTNDGRSGLVGRTFDADAQCRFIYGPTSRHCMHGNICMQLYCYHSNMKCITNGIPAAQGTTCRILNPSYAEKGVTGWCYKGECVPDGFQPTPVDGRWNSWSGWSNCTRSCGVGVSYQMRSCDRPRPAYGGKYCLGERRRYRTCNTQNCNPEAQSFREKQCSRYDSKRFSGKYYDWVPHTSEKVPSCSLSCKPKDESWFFLELSPQVLDGTRCTNDPEKFDLCIRGGCEEIGCDRSLNGNKEFDNCRICDDDAELDSCDREFPLSLEDIDKFLIPAEVTSISVSQKEGDKNLILVETGMGNRVIGTEYFENCENCKNKMIKYEAISASYFRVLMKEDFTRTWGVSSYGPLQAPMRIRLLPRQYSINLIVTYYIPIKREGTLGSLRWKFGNWTECSTECGGGYREKVPLCHLKAFPDSDEKIVDQEKCPSATQPDILLESCNNQACAPVWHMSDWNSCSQTCGSGFQHRTVVCKRRIDKYEEEVVADTECLSDKPEYFQSCNTKRCPPIWTIGKWQECNPTCGRPGWTTRHVNCVDSTGTDPEVHLDMSSCNQALRPSRRKRCHRPCPAPQWRTSEWSECSSECRTGSMTRNVECVDMRDRILPNYRCNMSTKPVSSKTCKGECIQPVVIDGDDDEELCVDTPEVKKDLILYNETDPRTTYCAMVLRFDFCVKSFFRTKCCATCSAQDDLR
ncbi:unnamed protein product [Oikopleura dioica]|uniref:Peptidase M12B domain-containing protein n=1 Tax=Oikopleura dioica TaxID=34765 RepID=E4WY52_OIKDI|nr:unnamed protein product [Oikopleura dioica]